MNVLFHHKGGKKLRYFSVITPGCHQSVSEKFQFVYV